MRVKELGARKETNREWLKEVSKCMSAAIRVSINLRNFTFPEIGKFREISLQKKGTTCICIQNRHASSGLSKANWCLEIIWLDSLECKHHFCEAIGKLGPFLRKNIEMTNENFLPKNYFKNVPSFFVRWFLRNSSKSTSKTLRKTKHV